MTVVTTPAGARVIVGVQVVETYAVCELGTASISFYEVDVAVDDGPDTPRTKLLTRDLDLYRAACDAEGTAQKIDCEVKPAKRRDGRPVQQLVGLWRSV